MPRLLGWFPAHCTTRVRSLLIHHSFGVLVATTHVIPTSRRGSMGARGGRRPGAEHPFGTGCFCARKGRFNSLQLRILTPRRRVRPPHHIARILHTLLRGVLIRSAVHPRHGLGGGNVVDVLVLVATEEGGRFLCLDVVGGLAVYGGEAEAEESLFLGCFVGEDVLVRSYHPLTEIVIIQLVHLIFC